MLDDPKTERPEELVSAAIQEPRIDWAPLRLAPFYCFSNGFIHSKEWSEAMCTEVKRTMSKVERWVNVSWGPPVLEPFIHIPNENDPDPVQNKMPSWSVERDKKEEYRISVIALNMRTSIAPGSIYVCTGWSEDEDFGLHRWFISGSSALTLKDLRWDQLANREEQVAARWHKDLLQRLFWEWQSNFVQAIKVGAAYIMSRKNSILAPFERVTWDQWQYFRLKRIEAPHPRVWHDPREDFLLWTAIGPAGEKLYDIHIAPGRERPSSLTLEEKCRQWLTRMMQEYPDRPPLPLRDLYKEAVSRFPGLSQRAFFRCVSEAQAFTENRQWSEAGRPPKSPQKSSQ